MDLLGLLETFAIAFLLSYLLTPFVGKVALKLNYLDRPKNNKIHAYPVPLLGGVAIFLAFIITVVVKFQAFSLTPLFIFSMGCFVLLTVGLIDDKMGMMPRFKLFGQFLAAMLIIKSGVRAGFMDSYYLNVIFSYVWIIGITNSFNLLDNMNGLSSGIAGISAVFLGIIAYLNGQISVSIIAFAIAGSSFGFLKHNFPKAKIFMGDSGSLVLGYTLSVLAIMVGWQGGRNLPMILVPFLILGYPIFDTMLVAVMRILQKRSIFQGGKDHSSHMLSLLGFKRFRAVLVVYAICVLLGITALIVSRSDQTISIALSSLALGMLLIFGIRLGIINEKRFGNKGKKT